jgi:hypothetical protein
MMGRGLVITGAGTAIVVGVVSRGGGVVGGGVVGGGGVVADGGGIVIGGCVAGGDGGAGMVAGVARVAGVGLAVLAPGAPQALSAAPNPSPMTMMMTDAGLRTLMVVASPRWACSGYGARAAAGFIARTLCCVSFGTSSVRIRRLASRLPLCAVGQWGQSVERLLVQPVSGLVRS